MVKLEENNILKKEQLGFRKEHGCLEHALSLYLICKNRILLKKDTFMCFIDLKKAFDSVNCNLLWYKLQLYGLSGALLNNITALYKRVEYSLEINDPQTQYFEVKRSVKQRCILSSTVFNIFISDLISFVQELDKGIAIDNCKVSILLYADDVVLVAENEQDLQILIDRVDFWCEKNEMSININKKLKSYTYGINLLLYLTFPNLSTIEYILQ